MNRIHLWDPPVPLPVAATATGDEIAEWQGQAGFFCFYHVASMGSVSINLACRKSEKSNENSCQHRAIFNSRGILDLNVLEVVKMLELHSGAEFEGEFAGILRKVGVVLRERAMKKAVRAIAEYLWSPPLHFRKKISSGHFLVASSRANANRFEELFAQRFRVDDSTEEVLAALCSSDAASPGVIRRFLEWFPRSPVTSSSLSALCFRTESSAETLAEITSMLLFYPSCLVTSEALQAARNAAEHSPMKDIFAAALTDATFASQARRRARERSRARMLFKAKGEFSKNRHSLASMKCAPLYRGYTGDVSAWNKRCAFCLTKLVILLVCFVLLFIRLSKTWRF